MNIVVHPGVSLERLGSFTNLTYIHSFSISSGCLDHAIYIFVDLNVF